MEISTPDVCTLLQVVFCQSGPTLASLGRSTGVGKVKSQKPLLLGLQIRSLLHFLLLKMREYAKRGCF